MLLILIEGALVRALLQVHHPADELWLRVAYKILTACKKNPTPLPPHTPTLWESLASHVES